MKTCLRCKEPKDLNEFGVHKRKSDGRNNYCRLCAAEMAKVANRRKREMQDARVKQCKGECGQLLPLTEFGRNAKYRKCGDKDGKEVVCKGCINARNIRYRQEKAGERVARPIQLSLLDRVVVAIESGARTQPQIAWRVRIKGDRLGKALVVLMLEQKKVGTRVIDETREYFVRAA